MNEKSVRNIHIVNSGKFNFDYEWVLRERTAGGDSMVSMMPPSGGVMFGETQQCQLAFCPPRQTILRGCELLLKVRCMAIKLLPAYTKTRKIKGFLSYILNYMSIVFRLLITEYSLFRGYDLFASGLLEVLFAFFDCTPVCTNFVPVLNRSCTSSEPGIRFNCLLP